MSFMPVASPQAGSGCSPSRRLPSQKHATVTVIAPGGGTGINGSVYAKLDRDPRFTVDIVGQSRANYDCYPEDWSHGGPPPNLQTFAHEVLMQGILDNTDVLVVGSRGGQVVLPNFWAWGVKVPPTLVINGGCAMKLPTPVRWPDEAITFILLGGQDNFRGNFTHEEYLDDAKYHTPVRNGTTAILYVNEMQHMPQASLLGAVLPHILTALQKWEASGSAPLEEFRPILAALNRDGWSGRLVYTRAPGDWEDVHFSSCEVTRLRSQPPCRSARGDCNEDRPIELTRRDELQALWKAAARASLPKGGAPAPDQGTRFTAVVQAATAQAAFQRSAGNSGRPPTRPRPLLPIATAGHGDPKALRGGYTPHPLSRHRPDPTPISRALGLNRPSPCSSRGARTQGARGAVQYQFFLSAEVAVG